MPNPTVQANTRDLWEAGRRSFLRGAITATAVALAPAAGAAGTPVSEVLRAAAHPDVELFALIREGHVLDALADEAFDAAEDLREQVVWPEPPSALFRRPSDGEGFQAFFLSGEIGAPFSANDVGGLRNLHSKTADQEGEAWLSLGARMREVVDAWDDHQAARERTAELSGLRGAERHLEDVNSKQREHWRRIAMKPAMTRDGLMAKLAFAAPHFEPDDGDDTNADAILASVAVDYQNIAVLGKVSA